MPYLDDVAQELCTHLANHPGMNEKGQQSHEEWEKSVVAYVRQKLLQSYKNGAEAERNRKAKNKTVQPKKK